MFVLFVSLFVRVFSAEYPWIHDFFEVLLGLSTFAIIVFGVWFGSLPIFITDEYAKANSQSFLHQLKRFQIENGPCRYLLIKDDKAESNLEN